MTLPGPARPQARRDPTQRSLEARLRNARYLAELPKFGLAPAGAFFSQLKGLLDDFSGHNVDAAAGLVEAAGRFLFCAPETQTRISNMLDVGGLIAVPADASHADLVSRSCGQMCVPSVCQELCSASTVHDTGLLRWCALSMLLVNHTW